MFRGGQIGWLKRLEGTSGAQLLEFALSLPFLAVIVVGIIDFGQAYNTKHIMVNAAREAARIVVSNPLSDSSCPTGWNTSSPFAGTPCTITAAADDVGQYLNNAGLTLAACFSSSAPTAAGVVWTYDCKNGVTLTINKGYVVAGGAGGVVSSTQVTLSYPFTWTFGNVIGLLVPGATGPTGKQTLTTHVVMANMVLD
ncbi:MAG: TadE/TadG family type IV pilus assembly protein [Terriglobia bacterium]